MIKETPEQILNELDIESKFIDYLNSKIRKYPCYVNRASSIGYFVPSLNGCIRRGVYERTNWQDKEPISPQLQAIFEEGHFQETRVLQTLSFCGIEIIEQQQSFTWDKYQISGHIDGAILYKGYAVPIEIKSMSPNIFANIHTYDDFTKKPWTMAYKAQINLYMLMKNIDRAIYILKNKSTGMLKVLVIPLDYELAEECIKTCETINKHIVDKTLPDKITDVETCRNCPFKLICCPDINFGVPLSIEDDPEFINRVNAHSQSDETKKEIKNNYEILKERIRASADKTEQKEVNMIAGDFHIVGKYDKRGAFRIKIKSDSDD